MSEVRETMTVDAGTLSRTLTPPPIRLPRPALFLDLDGVLAPLAATPDAVGPDPRRTAVLHALRRRLSDRVAVISGRTLDEIDRISGGAAHAASGVHGLELRDSDGVVSRRAPDPAIRTALGALEEFAADRPGVLVEDKGGAVGLHFRQAPDQAGPAEAVARSVAADTGLAIQPGSMVFELKTPGANKGDAVRAFMARPPFAGATPVMIGDDLTDEHGFEAAAALGGFGVLVGPGRDTAARHGLADVAAVLDWLDRVEAAA